MRAAEKARKEREAREKAGGRPYLCQAEGRLEQRRRRGESRRQHCRAEESAL